MPPITTGNPLVLASGSRYRAELLARLRVPFIADSPDIDETPLPGERGEALAMRLAIAKARTVAGRQPGAWVLGSDQVVVCGAQILGKPGDRGTAIAQLEAQSGQIVEFLTAMVLLHGAASEPLAHLDCTRVHFRSLARAEIEAYVDAEPAFDCAGSFKSEGLGIALCERIIGEDPTALIGLPLIATRRLLAEAGWSPLKVIRSA